MLAAVVSFAPATSSQHRLPADEHEAYTAMLQGRPGEAGRALVTLAEATTAPWSPSTAARVEAWSTLALDLDRQLRLAPEIRDRTELLRARAASAAPLLADRLGSALLDHAVATADPRAMSLANELGCIDEFWLCGPFDNERGNGHRRVFPPESGVDLDASYAGRQHAVAWRRLPRAAAGGLMPLDAVLRPNEQCLAYLAVALHAETGTEVVLELGTTGSYRVFCNGALAGERVVVRHCARDQDAIPLALLPGANLLLLKLCHEEGAGFQCLARLRRHDGTPLRGLRTSAEPADLTTASERRAPDSAAALAPPDQGGRTTLASSTDPGDRLRLAWLLARAASDGDQQPRAVAAAAAAAAALPDVAFARWLLAEVRSGVRRSAGDRDDNERRRDYEAALVIDPRAVRAMVGLGRLLLDGTALRAEAERLVATALSIAPHDSSARLLQADVLEAAGQGVLARAGLAAAAAEAAASPQLLRRAAESLSPEQLRQSIALWQRVCERSGAAGDHLALADSLLRGGERAAAERHIALAARFDPFDRAAYRLRAALHEADGDPLLALQAWADWTRICPDDDEALLIQSRLHGQLGASDRQIELLRAALELAPVRRDERRYLEFLEAAVVPFHASFELDGRAELAACPAPPADAELARDPLHHVLRQRVVKAHRNGTTSEYLHFVIRVLTEEGARSLQRWRLPHWPGEQRARLLGCTIHKADGSVQRPDLRGAGVALPSLQPGDVLDVKGRIDDLAPSFFGDSFGLVHSLASPDGSPVARSLLVVLADPGRDYRWQSSNGAPEPERKTLPDGTLSFGFELRNVPRDRPEPNRPRADEREPLVRVSTWRDWDHFASWWWHLIEPQLQVTDAMRNKVLELTAGLADDAARIAAIYRFVTTEVRYEAWEFGVHGYKPYSTSVVFERRHGDCKDKALLLAAMLSVLDIPCRPVLIRAEHPRSRDDLTLPLVQQFNHCIAWLPPHGGRTGMFLDGTAVYHPPDTLPDMDQGASVLVVDEGKAELREVPCTTPEANCNDSELDIALAADGSATIAECRAPRGNAAVPLREALSSEPARRQQQFERELGRRFGTVQLETVQGSDPLRLDLPVELRLRARVPQLGQRRGNEWMLPGTWSQGDLQRLVTEPQRTAPLLLGIPGRQRLLVRYRPPVGYQAAELPAAATAAGPFGSFSLRFRREGSDIVVERQLDLTADRIEPTDYPAFRDFLGTVKDADSQQIVLRREAQR